MATDNKIILNKTRSSTERWTFVGQLTGGELVNGKNRFKFSDFCSSDHPMKEQVLDWMTEKGVLPAPVETSNEFPANETTGPSLQHIFSTLTGDEDESIRENLVSFHFGDLNREKGKGATRRLRKQLRAMGYTRLAALKAS
jgi:hypothetical protein